MSCLTIRIQEKTGLQEAPTGIEQPSLQWGLISKNDITADTQQLSS